MDRELEVPFGGGVVDAAVVLPAAVASDVDVDADAVPPAIDVIEEEDGGDPGELPADAAATAVTISDWLPLPGLLPALLPPLAAEVCLLAACWAAAAWERDGAEAGCWRKAAKKDERKKGR